MKNLRARVAAEIARQPCLEATRVERIVSVRSNSVIFYAQPCSEIFQPVAIKFCRVPGTDTADAVKAKNEFAALHRVHASFAHVVPRFAVPMPLWLSANLGIYAMAWIDGKSLTSQLGQLGGAESL